MKMLDRTYLSWISVASVAMFAVGCTQAIEEPEDETWQLEPEVVLLDEDEPAPTPEGDPVITPDPITGEDPVPTEDPTPNPIEDPDPTPAPIEPTPKEDPLPALMGCDVEQIWWQEEPVSRLTSTVFDVSPDESMLVRGEGDFGEGWSAVRLNNGEMIIAYSQELFMGISQDFKRGLKRAYDQEAGEYRLQVHDLERDAVLLDIDQRDWSSRAVLDADGDRVATYTCEYVESEQRTYMDVQLWDVPSGQMLAQERTPQDGCSWYTTALDVQISPDGSMVAFISNFERRFGTDEDVPTKLHLLSYAGDRVRVDETPVPRGDSETDLRYYGQVAALRFSPDSSSIHVVSGGGLRSEFSTETFELLSQEPRGAFVSNPDTYLPPLPMSPMDWTADGEVMASIGLDRAVELRGRDGEVFHRIFAPEQSDIAEWNEEQKGTNSPVSIDFAPDGETVAVSFRKGIGLWGCRDSVVDRPSGLRAVSIDVPEVAFAGTDLPLEVALEGQGRGPWTIYKLYVDGYLRASATTPEELKWRVNSDGIFNVEVEVDDGWGAVRSEEHTIRFTHPL